jgi:hypothetical protein
VECCLGLPLAVSLAATALAQCVAALAACLAPRTDLAACRLAVALALDACALALAAGRLALGASSPCRSRRGAVMLCCAGSWKCWPCLALARWRMLAVLDVMLKLGAGRWKWRGCAGRVAVVALLWGWCCCCGGGETVSTLHIAQTHDNSHLVALLAGRSLTLLARLGSRGMFGHCRRLRDHGQRRMLLSVRGEGRSGQLSGHPWAPTGCLKWAVLAPRDRRGHGMLAPGFIF